MAITHQKSTGTTGTLLAYDYTDDPDDRRVTLYIKSSEYVASSLDWSYLQNGIVKGSGREPDLFENSLTHYIATVYVAPDFETFTFRIENTRNNKLGGPTELTFTLAGYDTDLAEGTVRVKVGDVYKLATPYVRKNGSWKLAKPFVKTPTGWVEIQ